MKTINEIPQKGSGQGAHLSIHHRHHRSASGCLGLRGCLRLLLSPMAIQHPNNHHETLPSLFERTYTPPYVHTLLHHTITPIRSRSMSLSSAPAVSPVTFHGFRTLRCVYRYDMVIVTPFEGFEKQAVQRNLRCGCRSVVGPVTADSRWASHGGICILNLYQRQETA